jgi:hypothetical protein
MIVVRVVDGFFKGCKKFPVKMQRKKNLDYILTF